MIILSSLKLCLTLLSMRSCREYKKGAHHMESDGVKRSTTLRHDAPTQVTIVSPTKGGRHGNKRIIVKFM